MISVAEISVIDFFASYTHIGVSSPHMLSPLNFK
jgi:hypothetical protein